MQNKKLAILFICIDPSMGGSTASLYNLIISIIEHIQPIVLFPSVGVGYDFFMKNGIESYVYPFPRLNEMQSNNILDVWKHPWHWHSIKKLRFDYGCLNYVKEILNGRHIDIIHSNTSPNDIGVLLARRLHAKHVWHVREFCDVDYLKTDIYKGLPRLRNLINNADARIAISSSIKSYWQMPDQNTWVLNDAVCSKNDICYFPNKDNYLLFSSYFLMEAKGCRSAIQAFAKSGVYKCGLRLKLMGHCTDEYKESLLKTACDLGVQNDIEFIPCQREIKPWFAHAKAFIMSSKCEGLGRTTIEAMFYGCPVIAHATGGTLDIVKTGETGYLFNSIDECANLIQKVCKENQELIIKRAQLFAAENLSQEAYGPKIMQVYNCLLDIHD